MNIHTDHPTYSFQDSALKVAQNLVPLSRAIFWNGFVSEMTLSIAYKIEKLTFPEK